jgi:hypothetical protein
VPVTTSQRATELNNKVVLRALHHDPGTGKNGPGAMLVMTQD